MTALLMALRRWLRRVRARRRVRSRAMLPCLLALALGLAGAGCGERPAKYIFVPEWGPSVPADTLAGPGWNPPGPTEPARPR